MRVELWTPHLKTHCISLYITSPSVVSAEAYRPSSQGQEKWEQDQIDEETRTLAAAEADIAAAHQHLVVSARPCG